MTPARLSEVLDLYNKKINEMLSSRTDFKTVTSTTKIKDMLQLFPDATKDWSKAMRWLGFIQGVFWSMGEYTIEQLKEHNKTIPTDVDEFRDSNEEKFVENKTRQIAYHSLDRYTSCQACGDLDGCHQWQNKK